MTKAVKNQVREKLGFRDGDKGVHSSRSMMFKDIDLLMPHAGSDMTMPEFRRLVVEENVLHKPTRTTREHTVRKLKVLYGLDPSLPIYRAFIRLWELDAAARPLLALLSAYARDPLLRMAAPAVLGAQVGAVVTKDQIVDAIDAAAPDRFSEKNLTAIATRIRASFTQSGHLEGRSEKHRTRAEATPVSGAFGFFLAYLEGYHANRIFTSHWAQLLDRTPDELIALAHDASRRGLVDFKQVGKVVEMRFPDWLTPEEGGWLE